MKVDYLKFLKPTAHVQKHEFDLSCRKPCSMKAGELKVLHCIDTVPGDYFEIDAAALLRTQTMVSAPFLRANLKVDVFRVHHAQTWHPFNQFIGQREDKHTTLQKGLQFVPTLSVYSLLKSLWYAHRCWLRNNSSSFGIAPVQQGYWSDVHGNSIVDSVVQILSECGYGDYSQIYSLLPTSFSSASQDPSDEYSSWIVQYQTYYVNLFRIAAYQHIFYDFYRNKQFDLFDNGYSSADSDGGSNSGWSEYITGFNFDDLDCSTLATSRLELPEAWSYWSSPNMSESPITARFHALFCRRYHQYKKDLLTAVLPSTQIGAVQSVSLTSDAKGALSLSFNGKTLPNDPYYSLLGFPRSEDAVQASVSNIKKASDGRISQTDLAAAVDGANNDIPIYHNHTFVVGGSSDFSLPSGASLFDVLSLRRAEVLQKYYESLMRAGNKTDDVWQSQFGTTPFTYQSNEVEMLGSFQSRIDVTPVEATADSDAGNNGAVGDLGGRGTSVLSGKKIKVECRDYSTIMFIASIVPDSEYTVAGIDESVTFSNNFDFFQPKFQNLGMVPVTQSLLDFSSQPSLANQVIGYAPRYFSYKTAVDRVGVGFYNRSYTLSSTSRGTQSGDKSFLVTPRSWQLLGLLDGLSGQVLTNRRFYVSPSVFNSVFGVAATGSRPVSDGSGGYTVVPYYYSDQFILNPYFDVKAVRPMSVLGLVEF